MGNWRPIRHLRSCLISCSRDRTAPRLHADRGPHRRPRLAWLDDAIARARAFARDGTDIVFVEAPHSEVELEQVGQALAGDAWLFANMVPSGNSLVVFAENLQRYGYSIVIYPTAGMNAARAALEQAYRHLGRHGSTDGSPVLAYSMAKLHELVGFPEVWGFERRWVEK